MTEKDFLYFVAGQEKYLIRKAWARVGDHAEDIFQDTVASFLAPGVDGEPGYTKYPGYPNQMFVQELRKVFFFRTVDYIRTRNKGAWKDQAPLFDSDLDVEMVDGPDVAVEAFDRLRQVPLWKLTEKQLVVLDMYYGHGLGEQEIAEGLSLNQSVVSRRITRAIEILRETDGIEWDLATCTDEEWKRFQVQEELLGELWKERDSLASVLPALIHWMVVACGPPVAIDPPDPALDEPSHDPQNGGP